MAEKLTKKSQVIAQIIMDLSSDNEDTVLKAILKTRSKGSSQLIPDLFNAYSKGSSKVKHEITLMVNELKSTDTLEPLVDQLESEQEELRILAMGAIWNSGFDASAYIDTVVQTAINGSFMESFEALTIIENMEPPFEDEEVILNAQFMLKEYFAEPRESEKDNILRTITSIVSTINGQLQ